VSGILIALPIVPLLPALFKGASAMPAGHAREGPALVHPEDDLDSISCLFHPWMDRS
jgi:hypothetical protein